MNEIIRLKITFNFEFIENIDSLLANIKIIQKSFNKDVSYTFDIDVDSADKLIYYLLLTTSKQIKIENISAIKDQNIQTEVGTDKPIGSKSAIDEN